MNVTGILKISDIPKKELELSIKAFKIFGKLIEEKRKVHESSQRTVRYT